MLFKKSSPTAATQSLKPLEKSRWRGFIFIITFPLRIPIIIYNHIRLTRRLFGLFVLKPLYYAILNYASKGGDDRNYKGKIARRIKINPAYKKSFPLILKRYEKRLKANKIRRQTKLDLDESFSGLVYAVLVISVLWTMMNSFVMYRNFFVSIKNKIETQSSIVDLISTNMLNAVDNYLNYVGDRALVFDAKHNLVAMKNILKKTPNRDIMQRNISSWLTIQFVDVTGKISVSTNEGILKKPRKPNNYFPIAPAVADPWRFKIGKMQHFESEIASYDYLPVTMSVDTDSFIPIGTMMATIPVDRIQHNIRESLNENDLCYIVIDKNYDLVAQSDNLDAYDGAIFQSNDLIKTIVENKVILRADYIKNKIAIKNCELIYYRLSSYGITTLVGYNNKVVLQIFSYQILTTVIQSFGITFVLLLAFYLFRKLKIGPFLKELVSAKIGAEDANKVKGQFLSNMSHELRTPLNGILGMSQALLESHKLQSEELDQANVIYRSADSLLLILNDILNFSKIEARKVDLESIDFNLTSLVDDVTDLMSQTANSKGLEVISYIDPNVPTYLNGDPGRIRQILTNLINNAIKFTFHGQVFVHIKLSKIEGKNYFLILNIKDSGIGIEKEKIAKMFTRFTQADMSTTRKYGGTGLGLSICKELVDLMDGDIGVESDFGTGSNFWFKISLLLPTGNIQDELDDEPIKKLNGKNIALIESNEIARYAFNGRVEKLGMNCVSTNVPSFAMSSQDMMKIIFSEIKKFHNPDIIFIDHNNSIGMSGIDIAEHIRSIENLKNIPLVLMISTKDKISASQEKLTMFQSIMLKPFKTSRITRSLFKIFDIEHAEDDFLLEKDSDIAQNRNKKDGGIHILLCEDNEVNMKVATMILKRLNITVDFAENGQEALNKFLHIKYDIILMDCMMPIIDGYQATAEIRKFEKENKITPTTIIALTANATEEDKKKCLAAGMDDFITKPIRREFIEERINSWVAKNKNLAQS